MGGGASAKVGCEVSPSFDLRKPSGLVSDKCGPTVVEVQVQFEKEAQWLRQILETEKREKQWLKQCCKRRQDDLSQLEKEVADLRVQLAGRQQSSKPKSRNPALVHARSAEFFETLPVAEVPWVAAQGQRAAPLMNQPPKAAESHCTAPVLSQHVPSESPRVASEGGGGGAVPVDLAGSSGTLMSRRRLLLGRISTDQKTSTPPSRQVDTAAPRQPQKPPSNPVEPLSPLLQRRQAQSAADPKAPIRIETKALHVQPEKALHMDHAPASPKRVQGKGEEFDSWADPKAPIIIETGLHVQPTKLLQMAQTPASPKVITRKGEEFDC